MSRKTLSAIAAAAIALVAAPATRAADVAWSPPELLGSSDLVGGGTDPEVVVDAAGNALAYWTHRDGAYRRVRATFRPAGGTWEAARWLSAGGRTAKSPEGAIGPGGNAVVVWERDDGEDDRIQWVERSAAGAWGTSDTLSPEDVETGDPDVAFGGAGGLTIAWSAWVTYTQIQAVDRTPGGAWGTIEPLSEGDAHSTRPQLAPGPNATMYAAWGRSASLEAGVFTALRAANGTWSAMTELGEDPDIADNSPQLAVDPAGRATAVWTRFDDEGTNELWLRGARNAGAATWGDLDDVTDRSPFVVGALDAQVAVDAAGTATAVWQQKSGTSLVMRSATRAVGATWTEPVPMGATNPSDSLTNASLGVSGAGTATAAWNQRIGGSVQVETAWRAPGGAWSQRTVHTATDAGDPDVAVTPSGMAIVIWTRNNGGDADEVWASIRPADPTIDPVDPGTGGGAPPATPVVSPPAAAPPPAPSGARPAGTESPRPVVRSMTARSDGTVRLTVRVAGAGRLRAEAFARRTALAAAPRGTVRVARVTKTVRKAGDVTLSVKPAGRGLKRLRRSGRLAATLRLTFTPVRGRASAAVARRVTFRLAKRR